MSTLTEGVALSASLADDLIMEIGSLVVNDRRYDERWKGLALVGNFSNGQERMNGYQYFANGDFEPGIPKRAGDIIDKLLELRQEMKKEKDEEWHQCLIQITRPDFKINIQFEYDDPARWSVKNVSLDMSEYAELLKPAM